MTSSKQQLKGLNNKQEREPRCARLRNESIKRRAATVALAGVYAEKHDADFLHHRSVGICFVQNLSRTSFPGAPYLAAMMPQV